MRARRWLVGLVAALWLAGCAAGRAYQDGVDLEAAGRLPAAASRYLDALDRNPSHAAAIRYCYEKELQRQPSLSGKVELYWLIRPNGNVDRTKIAASTLGSREVEGCMERQVKNWQFPRSDTETIVQSYPFFFKGGG